MHQFFKDFLKKNKWKIGFFSFWRLISLLQVLFWPYGFSKIVNIITENPQYWQEAIFWAILIAINSVTEDFVRIQSKLGLEKLGAKLKVRLALFFCQKTKIRDGKKTGEAMHAVQRAGSDIQGIVNYYKDNLLQLPINFIAIPIILFKVNVDYLLLFLAYSILYLTIDFLAIGILNKRMRKFYKKADVFWGTAYRKTPEFWREREDGQHFFEEINQEAKDYYQADVASMKINAWRWTFLQCLSSASLGFVIFFIIYRIINYGTHIGDLVLVSSYFNTTQETLNIVTSTLTHLIQTKLSLRRLHQAIKIK